MRDVSIYLIVFVVIILVLLLQFNLFSAVTLVGTSANLGIVLITAIGLMTGKERGAAIGAFYGLLLDILIGKCLGLYLSMYLLLGYFCGRMGKGFSKENRTTTVAMVGVGTVILEGAIFLLQVFLYQTEFVFLVWSVKLAKETLYNMLIAIIAFPFLYQLSDLINRTKNNYYLL